MRLVNWPCGGRWSPKAITKYRKRRPKSMLRAGFTAAIWPTRMPTDSFTWWGRSREMINRGGENVYPVEVENVLHLHPKILDIAVFGLPDPVMGSIVACAIVPRPGTQRIGREEIQEYCKDQLASYKIPQKIFFVPELPTNPGGKVMKNELIQKFAGA